MLNPLYYPTPDKECIAHFANKPNTANACINIIERWHREPELRNSQKEEKRLNEA